MAMLGVAHHAVAAEETQAKTSQGIKSGFYIMPNAEAIFVPSKFNKNDGTPVGFGVGVSLGYRLANLLIDLDASYQHISGTSNIEQVFNDNNAVKNLAPDIANKTYLTKSTNNENFIPVTLGLKYAIPLFSNVFSITPGIAGGVWFHTIKRNLSYSDNADGKGTTNLGLFSSQSGKDIPTTDNASEVKGIIVPSLALDFAPSDSLTISLTGKMYIVPKGYSDNYNAVTRESVANLSGLFNTNFTDVNKTFLVWRFKSWHSLHFLI